MAPGTVRRQCCSTAFVQTDEAGDIPRMESRLPKPSSDGRGRKCWASKLISLLLPEALHLHRRKMREQLPLRNEEKCCGPAKNVSRG